MPERYEVTTTIQASVAVNNPGVIEEALQLAAYWTEERGDIKGEAIEPARAALASMRTALARAEALLADYRLAVDSLLYAFDVDMGGKTYYNEEIDTLRQLSENAQGVE